MAGTRKKPVQIYLREDQVEALRMIAERRGEPMAALVRQGVDKLLEELSPDEEPLLDIIGLYDSGIGDLAERHDQYLERLVKEESDRAS